MKNSLEKKGLLKDYLYLFFEKIAGSWNEGAKINLDHNIEISQSVGDVQTKDGWPYLGMRNQKN